MTAKDVRDRLLTAGTALSANTGTIRALTRMAVIGTTVMAITGANRDTVSVDVDGMTLVFSIGTKVVLIKVLVSGVTVTAVISEPPPKSSSLLPDEPSAKTPRFPAEVYSLSLTLNLTSHPSPVSPHSSRTSPTARIPYLSPVAEPAPLSLDDANTVRPPSVTL